MGHLDVVASSLVEGWNGLLISYLTTGVSVSCRPFTQAGRSAAEQVSRPASQSAQSEGGCSTCGLLSSAQNVEISSSLHLQSVVPYILLTDGQEPPWSL